MRHSRAITPKEVMSSILETEPPPLTHYIAHAPAELQQIISKTLRKDREERYHSAHELLQALKGLRRKLEVEAELERSTAAAQADYKWLPRRRNDGARIGHVLFVDIVGLGSSPLTSNTQPSLS